MITKSKYVKYRQCKKKYWYYLYKRNEMIISDSQKDRMDAGTEIGDLAMGLFDDYIDVTTNNSDLSLNLLEMVKKTKNEINNNTINICEASFIYDDLYCAVDILHKVNDGYEIYEVKSSTHIEDYYIIDAAFQKYVLSKCGLNIKSVNIVTINNKYIRSGDLNINDLFLIHNITDKINNELEIIEEQLNLIRGINNTEFDISFTKSCDSPFKCEFYDYCHRNLCRPNIFDLANNRKKYTYYNENIISYEDLYNSKYYNKLTLRNKFQIDYHLNDLGMYINKENIKKFLDSITYPLYLLDFETMQPVIPLYDNTRPYQQIPFQYSLHIINKKGEKPIHKEFLANEGENPMYELAKTLINDIPDDKMVMAYNMTFEKSRIKELAEIYPEFANKLNKINENFIDLMTPFNNLDIYLKEFNGSYSIKYVLPGLFPNDEDLNYKNLNIVHNGSEAMTIYKNLLNYDPLERLKIRKALLEYCKLDTYAMVKILNKLYELVE